MADKNTIDYIALVLLIIGGVNWLLFAFGFNLVSFIFDSWAPIISTIVYVLVGISALYTIYFMTKK